MLLGKILVTGPTLNRTKVPGDSDVLQAGAIILTHTAEGTACPDPVGGVAPAAQPTAQLDPGKMILDPVISPAIGGDCLADIATPA